MYFTEFSTECSRIRLTEQDKMTAFLVTSVFNSMDKVERDGRVSVDEFVEYNVRVGKSLSDYEFKKQARARPIPTPAPRVLRDTLSNEPVWPWASARIAIHWR